MRTFKTWLTTIVVLLCSITASAEAVQIDGIWYNLKTETKQAEVTKNPDGVKYSGDINIPAMVIYNEILYNVKSIGSGAFDGCSNLTFISLPEGVTSVGTAAFLDCSNLTSITLPKGLESIGNGTFMNCSTLNFITIPESVTSIGTHAFASCTSLINITMPNGVTSIGDNTFLGCRSLTSITIPNGVTSIGNQAFFECSSLTSIIIPGSVTSIGDRVVAGCSNLAAIFCEATTPPDITDNTFFNITVPVYVPVSSVSLYKSTQNWRSVANIQPTGVCGDNLTWKINPEGELSIEGEGRMYDYTQKDAPWSSTSVKTVVIKEGVTHIGERAFEDCTGLTSITLPESVNSIGDGAFSGCYNQYEMHISSIEAWCNIDFETEECHPLWNSAANLYLNGELLTELSIPNTITTIKDHAFVSFYNLTSITLPENLTSIGEEAFYGCTNLVSVNIPKSVTSIGDRAFSSCSNMNSIIVENDNSVYDSRNNCNAIIETKSNTLFHGCSTTIIPKGVTSIKEYAFEYCTGLTSIIIPEGVKSIGRHSFGYCRNLAEISIPASIISIGDRAFNGVSSGELEVYCYADNIPSMNSDIFGNGDYLYKATLHVPANALEYYMTTDPWSDFGKYEALEIAVTDITLSCSRASLYEGETLALTVIVKPDNATDLTVTWSSSDEDVATVDADGLVTAVTSGIATIIAVANDGSGVSASCEIEVMAKTVVITDPYTEVSFIQEEDEECANITYTRTFNNTNWQALYVPFEIPVTEEFLADFEVADLNDVRQYDRDDDGVKDETVIEAFKVKSGVLEANYPYLIRAREAGEKTITVTDATLYATEENSIDCSSVREKFTFTGTYSQLSSEELPQGEGYYALSGGVWQPVADGASLGAFRFYLKVDSRNNLNAAQGNAIRMRIIGEDGEEDDATEIDTPEFKDQNSELIFDLQGRRVENPTKGVYIVNGVKRVF